MASRRKKRVVVIGGGPAGIQAAAVLIKRGHEVVVLEKEKQLGGKLHDINKLSFKGDLFRHTEWLVNFGNQCGAIIKCGVEASVENVLKEKPDVVVIATGSSAINVPIPGIEGKNVKKVLDVDSGREKVSGRIVICGGGVCG